MTERILLCLSFINHSPFSWEGVLIMGNFTVLKKEAFNYFSSRNFRVLNVFTGRQEPKRRPKDA